MGEVSGACSALATGWPGIAVPPGAAHSPLGEKIPNKSKTCFLPHCPWLVLSFAVLAAACLLQTAGIVAVVIYNSIAGPQGNLPTLHQQTKLFVCYLGRESNPRTILFIVASCVLNMYVQLFACLCLPVTACT